MLTVASMFWIVGVGMLDDVYQGQMSAETEEARERVEQDDVESLDAIVDHEIILIHGDSFNDWLKTSHRSALLSHSWRWCSRGPPAVS